MNDTNLSTAPAVRDDADALRLLLDHAREEFSRLNSRLSLVETKAQLTSAVSGALLGLLVALWRDRVHGIQLHEAVLYALALVTLGASLVLSVSASIATEVKSPVATRTLVACYKRTVRKSRRRAPGVSETHQHGDEESLAGAILRETCSSYMEVSRHLAKILRERARKVLRAQILICLGIVLMAVPVLYPVLVSAVQLLNSSR